MKFEQGKKYRITEKVVDKVVDKGIWTYSGARGGNNTMSDIAHKFFSSPKSNAESNELKEAESIELFDNEIGEGKRYQIVSIMSGGRRRRRHSRKRRGSHKLRSRRNLRR